MRFLLLFGVLMLASCNSTEAPLSQAPENIERSLLLTYSQAAMNSSYQPTLDPTSITLNNSRIGVLNIKNGRLHNLAKEKNSETLQEHMHWDGPEPSRQEQVSDKIDEMQRNSWINFAAKGSNRAVFFLSSPLFACESNEDCFAKTLAMARTYAIDNQLDYMIFYETDFHSPSKPTAIQDGMFAAAKTPVIGQIASSLAVTATSPLPFESETWFSNTDAYLVDVKHGTYKAFRVFSGQEKQYHSLLGRVFRGPSKSEEFGNAKIAQSMESFEGFLKQLKTEPTTTPLSGK